MTEVVKPYVFRKLKATDLFLVLNLVKKINLKNLSDAYESGIDEIIDTVKGDKDNETKEQDYAKVGMAMFNVAQVIIERLSDCENEIFALLEATSNLSMQEVKDLDINTFIDMVYDFVKLDGLTELFTRAVSLFNTAK